MSDTPRRNMSDHYDQHYVSCFYLSSFADPTGRISTYRVLVSRSSVPEWRLSFPKAVAYYVHLYTRIGARGAADEVENWFNREYETPAKEPLVKATHDARLTSTDWYYLVRFLAAQAVRTPARLVESMQRWRETLPLIVDATLRQSVSELEAAKKTGKSISRAKVEGSEYFPSRISTEIVPGEDHGHLKADILVGRRLWLFEIQSVLAGAALVLHDHRWTILKPPEGLQWFTSDDPVICLNRYDDGNYDFKGAWGNLGTEIFLPLGPQHLLYTRVGHRVPPRGSVVSHVDAQLVRRCIAEHAHRFIFAAGPEPDVPKLRPRTVDADLFRHESEQWQRWHNEQSAAEREFFGG